ncbi:hypothetical protein GUJ93_ZPchr0015g6910 [Zizania palustris]|uniref:Uncharacterized protein n=1 Tax=Zizania palustris TaxID=103762 RepID=A0A8J5SYM9_ZIZPA|nr:hypothetical protein GUJ93_ZPchr0015g6910 [Zizania palustris]
MPPAAGSGRVRDSRRLVGPRRLGRSSNARCAGPGDEARRLDLAAHAPLVAESGRDAIAPRRRIWPRARRSSPVTRSGHDAIAPRRPGAA